MESLTLLSMIDNIKSDAEQAGREIYYAISFLDNTHPARANLKRALELLGIHSPHQVGLSNNVLVIKKLNNSISLFEELE